MIRRSDDDEIGYGKPPRKNQFQPGQSGNPTGRPRRQAKSEIALPTYRPTQKLLRSEAERLIKVRDGERQFQIPVTQGVIRALSQSAMKGGVLAQRTYLALQQAEDLRLAQKQEENFKFWEDYVDGTRDSIEEAVDLGRPPPDCVPHPDDIRLDYDKQEIRILGPRNARQVEECKRIQSMCEMYYELIIFCDETKNGMPTDERPIYGLNTLMFAALLPLLPPRLRRIDDVLHDEILHRAMGSYRDWVRYLAARLKEHGFDVDPAKLKTRFIDLRDANLRLGKGGFEHYRWPKRKPAAGSGES